MTEPLESVILVHNLLFISKGYLYVRSFNYMQPEENSPKGIVYAIANQKGGVGKSTTTLHIAVGLAARDKKILVIDCDFQGNVSSFFLPNYEEFTKEETLYATIINRLPLTIKPTRYKKLDCVCSSMLLSDVDLQLGRDRGMIHARLRKQIDLVKAHYDYILIDCPPALSMLTLNAFYASDKLIVIVEPEKFSLDGIPKLSETIEFVQAEFGHTVELSGFLMNKADHRTKIFTDVKNDLQSSFGDKVYRTYLPYRTAVKDAINNDEMPLTMFEIADNDYARAINYFISEEFVS